MQGLAAPPRSAYTAQQIQNLLTGNILQVDCGLSVVDANGLPLRDLTPHLRDGTVHRDNYADIHGTVDLTLDTQLAWGKDWVQPYMLLSNSTIQNVRFNCGVFVLTTPDTQIDMTPLEYSVSGFDLLYLLQSSVGDTYVVPQTTYTSAARTIINQATGVPFSRIAIAESQVSMTQPWVYSVNNGDVTYLKMVNDLLQAVNYQGLWADESGIFRSNPYAAPHDRPAEFAFNAQDAINGLLLESRKQHEDVWSVPNWWRYVISGLTYSPAEGNGQHTIIDTDPTRLTSYPNLGRYVRAPLQAVTVSDQTSLEAYAERSVAAQMDVAELFTLKTAPFPVAGHMDIFAYNDTVLSAVAPNNLATRKVVAHSWDLPLRGGDMDWTWGAV